MQRQRVGGVSQTVFQLYTHVCLCVTLKVFPYLHAGQILLQCPNVVFFLHCVLSSSYSMEDLSF